MTLACKHGMTLPGVAGGFDTTYYCMGFFIKFGKKPTENFTRTKNNLIWIGVKINLEDISLLKRKFRSALQKIFRNERDQQ